MDETFLRRRRLLGTGAGVAAALLCAWAPAVRAAWESALFEARSPGALAGLLGASAPQEDRDSLQLIADEVVDNGSAVRVTGLSRLPGTRYLALMVERNPNLLAALFEFPDGTLPQITTQLKVAESSRLLLLAASADRSLLASRPLRVTVGGCGDDGLAQDPVSTPPRPGRIRAQVQDGRTQVRLMLSHPMESGQRKDAAGRPVPAHHIREVEVRHEGRTVLAAQWGPAVSRHPYLQFAFLGGQAGERLRVSWLDSRGAGRSDEATLA